MFYPKNGGFESLWRSIVFNGKPDKNVQDSWILVVGERCFLRCWALSLPQIGATRLIEYWNKENRHRATGQWQEFKEPIGMFPEQKAVISMGFVK